MSQTVEIPGYAVQDGVRLDPTRTALLVLDMQNDLASALGSRRA